MLNTPFSPWPNYSEQENALVAEILRSGKVNYWTGDNGKSFEKEFAQWTGCEYAVALANGTLALEAAILALGIGPGDEVIVTPRTFIASASTIVKVGATPIFADVDLNSQNITAETIKAVLTARTKAVICVHLAGWPCEMTPIMELATQHNFYVIEDCAQAHGAQYDGKSVGSIGHIGAWSFCQDKIMTTVGEGGMITTNDEALWSKIWSLKDHGKSFNAMFQKSSTTTFRWVHDSIGSNWRLTEIQSAIGRYQLTKMPEWHQQRLQNAMQIWNAAKNIPGLRVPDCPTHIEHAAYKAYVFIDNQTIKSDWTQCKIISAINALGVPCFSGSCSEVYLEKAFTTFGLSPKNRLPVAKNLGLSSLMFMVHPTLTNEELSKTTSILSQVMHLATNTSESVAVDYNLQITG